MTGKMTKLKRKNSKLIDEKKAKEAVEFFEIAIQVEEADLLGEDQGDLLVRKNRDLEYS